MSEMSEAQMPFTDLHPRSHSYCYVSDDKGISSCEISIWILQLSERSSM